MSASLLAAGVLLAGRMAAHSGDTPGPRPTVDQGQPSAEGPLGAHYGPGCLQSAEARLACAGLLELLNENVDLGADAKIRPSEIDASGATARSVSTYWYSDPDADSLKVSTKGGLPQRGMTVASEGDNFLVMQGSGATAGVTARISFSRSPTPGPHNDKFIVTVEITRPV